MAYETERDNLYIYVDIDILKNDYDCEDDELRTLMMNREGYRSLDGEKFQDLVRTRLK